MKRIIGGKDINKVIRFVKLTISANTLLSNGFNLFLTHCKWGG